MRASGVDVFDGSKMWRSSDGRVGLIGGFGTWGGFKDAEILAILLKRDEVGCPQKGRGS